MTVLEIIQMLPTLFQGTKLQNAAKRKVKSCVCTYMSYIEDLNAHSCSNEQHEWKVDYCYNAIMGLTDKDHPSGRFNNPWWAERGYEFPEGGGEDEEWMDEYMYKRNNR